MNHQQEAANGANGANGSSASSNNNGAVNGILTTANMPTRMRANSSAPSVASPPSVNSVASSHPGAPQNTPYTQSLYGNAHQSREVNSEAIFEKLRVTAIQTNLGDPTLVPTNTPAASHADDITPRSTSRLMPLADNLPTIDEALEALPPLASSTKSQPSSATGQAEDVEGETGTIVIGLGSPRVPTAEVQHNGSLGADRPAPLSLNAVRHEGVREHTDWHDTIEQDLEIALTRLTNLAMDDAEADPTKTAADSYRDRLSRMLNSDKRRFAFGELPEAVERPEPIMSGAVTPINAVSRPEFNALSNNVDTLGRTLQQVVEAIHRLPAQIGERMVVAVPAVDEASEPTTVEAAEPVDVAARTATDAAEPTTAEVAELTSATDPAEAAKSVEAGNHTESGEH